MPQRLFASSAKDRCRGKLKNHEFRAQQLVRVMHGIYRWTDHLPHDPWLLAFCNEVRCGQVQGLLHGTTATSDAACPAVVTTSCRALVCLFTPMHCCLFSLLPTEVPSRCCVMCCCMSPHHLMPRPCRDQITYLLRKTS